MPADCLSGHLRWRGSPARSVPLARPRPGQRHGGSGGAAEGPRACVRRCETAGAGSESPRVAGSSPQGRSPGGGWVSFWPLCGQGQRSKPGFLTPTAGHSRLSATSGCQGMDMMDRLARAAGDGDIAVVRRLLDAGAEVDAPVMAGRTALDLVVRAGHAETVGVLLAAGADLRQRAGEYAELTPLCLAAMCGHTAVVDVLLEAGAPTGAQGRMGYVPLVLARSLWWFRSSPFLFSLIWLFCFRLVVVAVRLCRRC